MFVSGQIVRCVSVNSPGLTAGKYYFILMIKDGFARVINDFGVEAAYSEERFRLPAEDDVIPDISPPRGETLPPSATSNDMSDMRGNGEVILLVDDNDSLRASAAELLRSMNYIVTEARDAAEALKLVCCDPSIQVVFTDIVMPGRMNGFDLARACLEYRPDLKVLLTTGFPLARNRAGPKEHLGWPLIGKPYRVRELTRHLRALLAQPGEADITSPKSPANC